MAAAATTKEECGLCRFWSPTASLTTTAKVPEQIGACRRYPPKETDLSKFRHRASWPLTESGEWCGEFAK